jgi:translation elongation factor EF-Ts
MSDSLRTYIHDHLAGAASALDLLDSLRDHYKAKPLGDFATRLHSEIASEKKVLHGIAEQFGTTSNLMKDTAAWIGEKASRVKFDLSDATGLGTFEALEFLRLGVHGKLSMWHALAEVAPQYAALSAVNFPRLIESAECQEEEVETQRMIAARKALAGPQDKVVAHR